MLSTRLKDLSKALGESRAHQASTARRTTQVLSQSKKENSDGSKEEAKPEFLQVFSVLDNVLGISAKVIAACEAQTQKLKRLRVEQKSREVSEQALIDDSHTFLDSMLPALMLIEL